MTADVGVWGRCGLLPNYFDHLLCLLVWNWRRWWPVVVQLIVAQTFKKYFLLKNTLLCFLLLHVFCIYNIFLYLKFWIFIDNHVKYLQWIAVVLIIIIITVLFSLWWHFVIQLRLCDCVVLSNHAPIQSSTVNCATYVERAFILRFCVFFNRNVSKKYV